jgi:putative SOS response-associated peptidase YedK
VILDRGEGRQVIRLARGLLPFWAKAKGLQGSTINARIETAATKPAFRSAFKKRRCVIPMAGYYEWSVSPEDRKKDPWFIHATGPLLAAGLWEDTSPLLPDGNLGTFTISPATAAASRPTSMTACRCGYSRVRSMTGWR